MAKAALSLIEGLPLSDQPGLGALTIGGYLREIVKRHGESEAVVLRSGDSRVSWSYDDLLARSVEVARALIASGVGKDARVGILMTNRPEFLSSLFGIALAGGVPVALSTFSTPSELDYLVGASQISVLLFEQRVLKKDFRVMLAELDSSIRQSKPGSLASRHFPFLRHLVSLGGLEGGGEPIEAYDGGAVEHWADFLARGSGIAEDVVFARADTVHPADAGGIWGC